jgi:hypothetical protein
LKKDGKRFGIKKVLSIFAVPNSGLRIKILYSQIIKLLEGLQQEVKRQSTHSIIFYINEKDISTIQKKKKK